MKRFSRRLSLALALAVLLTAMVPVTAKAAETESTWVELLETATVNDSGNNLFTLAATSGTFRIKTPQYMRCTKVDILISHPSGYAPTSVKVRYNGYYYTLTLAKIDAYTTRAYGANIPDNLYADLVFQFTKSGTTSVPYQILSCRVNTIAATLLSATAHSIINGTTYNAPFAMEYENPDGNDFSAQFQFPVVVTDWQKFDRITISGSVGSMGLNSVRCTIDNLGLPYEISYAVSNPTGADTSAYGYNEYRYYSYNESYQGETTSEIITSYDYRGKTLFTIDIDLTGVDRTNTEELYCYFTCVANENTGYTVQIMQVIGSVSVADVSGVSWWTKFQAFMTDLFGGDSSEADDFKEDMQQQGQEAGEDAEQIDTVTRPALDDVDVDIGQFIDAEGTQQAADLFGQLFSNNLVLTMVLISLMVALAAFIIFGRR